MGRRKFYQLVSGPEHTAIAGGVDWLDIAHDAVRAADFCAAVFDRTRDPLSPSFRASALTVFTSTRRRLQLLEPLCGFGDSKDDPLIVQVPKIWFQLVDGGTHAAFAGTSVQSLPLAEESSVDMLWHAVFQKVFRALLNHVREGKNLRVYDDVEAYKANRPVEEDEMSAALNQRGRAPDNLLCVVVPPSTNLQDVQLVVSGGHGTVIEFPEGTHILGSPPFGSKIFIRQCYPELLKMCMSTVDDETKNLPHVVIHANWGIGKTFFGFVLLVYLAQNGAAVVYEDVLIGGRVLFTADLVVRGSSRDFDSILRRPSTYYIVDDVRPRYYACETTLLTGLRRSVLCEVLYMPVWSKEQLLACHALMHTDTVPVERLEERYLRWGGIPRNVFKLALSKSILEVTINTTHGLESLLHYHVDERFRNVFVDFASQYVRNEVYKRLLELNDGNLLVVIAESRGVGAIASLRGLLNEGQEQTFRELVAEI
ncbi:hypothetical protein PHYSODRAFT_301647 [Phytophthora sojae]|uniref:Crinkler (CRN) family protein n=1 Tax=Phytophthora sojae (strain P6497) TaxID=1094619 RepID=G4ZK37_PHYSP|nr:hypothetical protein PHYSODRAFT_301647 [Phytophthora sojae]EGZ14841.1 hypothetical protein PHYSODRAFT_301647 [Phytophthora sojae]|eukprot:XP_009528590.1 hypothetical protein PHYSODRAFT_301647 [Phytophthora sojae]